LGDLLVGQKMRERFLFHDDCALEQVIQVEEPDGNVVNEDLDGLFLLG